MGLRSLALRWGWVPAAGLAALWYFSSELVWSGRVTDAAHQPLAGATVVLVLDGEETVQAAGPKGEFRFVLAKARHADYRLHACHPGYRPLVAAPPPQGARAGSLAMFPRWEEIRLERLADLERRYGAASRDARLARACRGKV